jgi:GT2 family glycosyltransferase
VDAGPPSQLTAVLVAYGGDVAGVERAIASLRSQTAPPAEILVVDNDPQRRTAAALEATDGVRVIVPGGNLGFAGGCNRAAAEAEGEHLLLLNPDAVADPDCVSRLLDAAAHPDVAVAGAQVLLPDGRTTNAGDNPIHLTGIAWSGRYLEPREHGEPRDTLAVSGAAMLVRRDAFLALGGFADGFLLYYEDADLCWRARIAGYRVVFCPDAIVTHEYAFEKGGYKWFRLERNRLWAVLSNLSLPALALLAPLLLATEAAIALAAARGGWLGEKLRAYGAILSGLPALIAHRRWVQAGRHVPDSVIVGELAASVDSPLLASRWLAAAAPTMRAYRRAVVAALALLERRSRRGGR